MYIDCSVANFDLLNHITSICTTVYLPKCSLRCPYCFNLDVVDNKNLKRYTESEFVKEINSSSQKDFVITGGEALFDFETFKFVLNTINKTNPASVQVNTNMMHPNELNWFIENVDNPFIAFDVKTELNRYDELNPIVDNPVKRIKASLNVIEKFLKKIKKVQCRTTLSDYTPIEDLPKLQDSISKLACDKFSWSLQDLEPKKIYNQDEVSLAIKNMQQKYNINILHNGE